MFEEIGDEGIANAKRNIAAVKSIYDGGNEELIRASQDLYELRVAKYGDKHEGTIGSGEK